MTTKSAKKKRNAMWEHDPRCCYCGVTTVKVEDLALAPGDPAPMNMATLDHVYSVRHPQREKFKYVLSCHECNAIKAMIECQDHTLEVHKEKTIKKLMIINRMIEFEKE